MTPNCNPECFWSLDIARIANIEQAGDALSEVEGMPVPQELCQMSISQPTVNSQQSTT